MKLWAMKEDLLGISKLIRFLIRFLLIYFPLEVMRDPGMLTHLILETVSLFIPHPPSKVSWAS